MSNFLKLQTDKLDVASIQELILHESCGGVSFFVGTTRDNFEDKEVTSLEYEAYDKMALKAMGQICDEMRAKWTDIVHIAIYHRLGLVAVKEASVIIGVSSPHRQTSLEAVQMAIDRLKQIVPIWKKESYATDSSEPGLTKSVFEKLRKRPKIDFSLCKVGVSASVQPSHLHQVPRNLIQIHADESEVKRRVECFVERKRDEINQNNVLEYIEPDQPTTVGEEADSSCARIRSSVYRSKNASSHLKVHRVKNEHGPQTRQTYTDALDKLMHPNTSSWIKTEPGTNEANGNEAINERLDVLEQSINIRPASSNVYERLKAIETRLIYLETVSPEYKHFTQPKALGISQSSVSKRAKKTHSVSDIDAYIRQLQQKSGVS